MASLISNQLKRFYAFFENRDGSALMSERMVEKKKAGQSLTRQSLER